MRFSLAFACVTSALFVGASVSHAAPVTIFTTTDGNGDSIAGADTFVTRNSVANASADSNLAVVNRAAADNNADRVSFVRFDSTGLTPANVTAATLRLTLGANASPAGLVLQIFGIPDAATNENFDASTVTFANSGYTTGTGSPIANDATDNTVLDSVLTLLGTIATPTISTTYTFSSPELLSFLQADTNGIASFVLTTTTITSGGTSTPVFVSTEGGTADTAPALLVQSIPEPTALAIFGLGGCAAVARRRRD